MQETITTLSDDTIAGIEDAINQIKMAEVLQDAIADKQELSPVQDRYIQPALEHVTGFERELSPATKKELSAKVNLLYKKHQAKNKADREYTAQRKLIFSEFSELQITEHTTSLGITAELKPGRVTEQVDLIALLNNLPDEVKPYVIAAASISKTALDNMPVRLDPQTIARATTSKPSEPAIQVSKS